MLNPDDSKPLRECKINKIPTVKGKTPLFDILNAFQEGRSHMAVVVKENVPIGIITLEDVLEELIQEEIYDESDMRQIGLAVKLETGDQLILASKKRRGTTLNVKDGRNKFKSSSHPLTRANTDSAIDTKIDNLPGDDKNERDLIIFDEPESSVHQNSISEPTSPVIDKNN
jgi:hypothetical protein